MRAMAIMKRIIMQTVRDWRTLILLLLAPVLLLTIVYVLFDSQELGATTFFYNELFPILIGFFVFFFVFLISGISLLRERISGTLERVLSTPIKRIDILLGYLGGYGLFAILQTLIIVLFVTKVLGIPSQGSLGLVFLINIIVALTALSLGALLSTLASSELQMVQFIPVAVVPQVFFSGLISIDNLVLPLQVVARIMPLYYAGDALQSVIIRGGVMGDIYMQLLILIFFIVVLTTINSLALRKYRRI